MKTLAALSAPVEDVVDGLRSALAVWRKSVDVVFTVAMSPLVVSLASPDVVTSMVFVVTVTDSVLISRADSVLRMSGPSTS